MVKLHIAATEKTVREALRALVSKRHAEIQRKRLTVEIDVEHSLTDGQIGWRLQDAFERLLGLAIQRCPEDTELTVTAISTSRGTEVEIADSGANGETQHSPSKLTAFAPCEISRLPGYLNSARTSVARDDAAMELYCTRCPQGGLAWTVVMREKLLVSKAA